MAKLANELVATQHEVKELAQLTKQEEERAASAAGFVSPDLPEIDPDDLDDEAYFTDYIEETFDRVSFPVT